MISKIGEGGFSKVFLVEDRRIGSLFVAKYMESQDMAQKEAEWLRRLVHPGLPRLHDFFITANYSCIIMEYMEGETLAQIIRRKGKLTGEECRKIAAMLCDILGILHSQNIPVIHGDLKPENVIVRDDGMVALLDLGGVAGYTTEVSSLYCTKGYAAPERMQGMCHVRNDIYSVGKIMQYAVTGCNPFYTQELKTETIMQYFGVEQALADIIIRCTNPDYRERYADAASLKNTLENFEKRNQTKSDLPVKFFSVLFGSVCMILFFYALILGYVTAASVFGWAGVTLIGLTCLIRREERKENIAILACEYSICLSETEIKLEEIEI